MGTMVSLASDGLLLEASIDAAGLGLVVLSRSGALLSCSQSVCRLLGYDSSELIGGNFRELTHPSDLPAEDILFDRLLSRNIPSYSLEKRYLRKEGDPVWVRKTVALSKPDADKGAELCIAIIQDISASVTERANSVAELRRSEIELRQQKAMLETIFLSAPEGIILVDMKGVITVANPTLGTMFGYASSEMIGKSGMLLYADPKDAAGVIAAQKLVLKDGHPGNVVVPRVKFMKKDGSPLIADLSGSRLKNAAGEYTGFIAVVRDISAQVRFEEMLERKGRLEAVGRLTGGVAHDFNNLLTIITGNFQLIRWSSTIQEAAEHIVEGERAAALGIDLVQKLLSFARSEPLQVQRINLHDAIKSALSLVQRSTGESVQVNTDLRASRSIARIDPGGFESALINAAVNSGHSMPDGGRFTLATTNVEFNESAAALAGISPGEFVRIDLSDTGIGMKPENLRRAFEPFFTTKQAGHGAGLGLASIHGFVRQSGGFVELTSQESVGTTLTMFLPLADDQEHTSSL